MDAKRLSNPDDPHSERKPEKKATTVAEAITDAGGILVAAAQKLKCNRRTVWDYCQNFDICAKARVDAEAATTDLAESKLVEQIREGNMTAIIFYLKTKAKARGYVERLEQTGAGGHPLDAGTKVLILPEVNIHQKE